MKLFYTTYTMTLERCSLLFETGNHNYLKRGQFPTTKKQLEKQYVKFQESFSKLFNQQAFKAMEEDTGYLIYLWNKSENLLNALKKGLLFCEDPELKKALIEIYVDEFGHEPTNAKDYIKIDKRIEQLRSKLKTAQSQQEKPKTETKNQSFESLIANVGFILKKNIDRNMKLFQFKSEYEIAVKLFENGRKSK